MKNQTPTPAAMMRLGLASWQLWADASMVVMLRSAQMMQGGPAADREAQRMVSEKVVAGATLGLAMWPLLAAGASPEKLATKALSHYSKPVGANRRRLSRGKA